MNDHHVPDRRLITGTGGSGKSTEFLRVLWESKAPHKFIFDPEQEVSRKLRWPICMDLEACAIQAAKPGPVCFDPSEYTETTEEGFDLFCSFVWNFSIRINGVKLMGADEVQDYTETNTGGIPKSFKRILQKGRKQEINAVFVTQELGEFHNKLRKQLSHIITFRHEDDGALDWLKRNRFDPEAVANLKYPRGFICRNRHTGEMTTGITKLWRP